MAHIKNLTVLIMLLLSNGAVAQSWQWLRGNASTPSAGGVIAVDTSGHIYTAGTHWSTMTVGPFTLTGAGSYLVKYDSAGNVSWAISTKAPPSTSSPHALVTDKMGYVYLLGTRKGTLDLGGHTLSIPGSAPDWYYFLAKIKWDGTVVWLKNIGDLAGVYGTMDIDPSGNLYVSGCFFNNPVLGSYSLTNKGISNILVAKLDTGGNVLWARSFGGKKDDRGISIAVTPTTNNIYVCGYFTSDTFNIGTTVLRDTSHVVSIQPRQFFLMKLNNSGYPLWATGSGGNGSFNVWSSLATDSKENVFVASNYMYKGNSITSKSLPDPPYNSSYGFVTKYDSKGVISWQKLVEGRSVGNSAIALDPDENVWLRTYMGYGHIIVPDTIDGYVVMPPAINSGPSFVSGWSNTGTHIAISPLSSGVDDYSKSMIFDKCGALYLTSTQRCDTLILATDTIINTPLTESMFIARYNTGRVYNCVEKSLQEPFLMSGIINIYPNPANNDLTVTTSDRIHSITITDVLGRQVLSATYASKKVSVNISHLREGTYQIIINGTIYRRFVKF